MATEMAVTPERLMQLGLGFMGSKTLLSAIELGVFTELASGPLDLQQLTEKLGLHKRSARDFLDTLVALGLLERQDVELGISSGLDKRFGWAWHLTPPNDKDVERYCSDFEDSRGQTQIWAQMA